MQFLNTLISFSLIFAIGFTQIYDPKTGEIINGEKESQIQFDPITGQPILNLPIKSTFQGNVNVRQLAYRDAKNNFNTQLTWSILGGGISLFSIPPLAIIGTALGGDELGFIGFLGGVSLAIVGVPKLLAKNESEPSQFVLQQSKIYTLSKEEKLEYINTYANAIEKKRKESINKGRIGWALGGFGSIILLSTIID